MKAHLGEDRPNCSNLDREVRFDWPLEPAAALTLASVSDSFAQSFEGTILLLTTLVWSSKIASRSTAASPSCHPESRYSARASNGLNHRAR